MDNRIFNVNEKMPDEGQSVMTCGRLRLAHGGDIPKWCTNWFTNGEFANYPECVQYWFPLPEIPEDVATPSPLIPPELQ